MPAVNIDTKGLGEAVAGVGKAALDIRAAITGQAVLDPTKQADLEMKLAEVDAQVMAAQAAVDAAEVARGGFAGNWRPALGWTCAAAFAYQYVIAPLGTWGLSLLGVAVAAPRLDLSELTPLVLGMLGLVGARSYEKAKGVAR
ncbi:MAG: 3TM-type holin [Vicinamibacterales bacterium]|jgi:hypothetical protein